MVAVFFIALGIFLKIAHHKAMERNDIVSDAKKLQTELVEIRRDLHARAETGFDVGETLQYLEKQLLNLGYTPKRCGKAGLVASAGEKKGGKCFLLRADIDGLPIQEKTGASFACKRGNMHACGHDLHAAMLLGAAKLLKQREEQLCGEVRLLFQPAEEILEGAKDVIDNGVLKGVDGAAMIHVLTDVEMPVGTLIVSNQVSAPAADFFTITINGKGCHGSSPWNGIDALTAAAHILLALQEIAARELSIAQPAVLTIGSLQTQPAGNVISDKAVMKGTLRAFDEEVRKRVKERMEKIARQVANAFRARVRICYDGGCPTLVNDEKTAVFAHEQMQALLGKGKVFLSTAVGERDKAKSGGSEDFAYIAQKVPSVMMALAAGERKLGYGYPLHHPKTSFDEKALYVGCAAYAQIAIAYLEKFELS